MERLFNDEDPRTVAALLQAYFAELGGNLPMRDFARAVVDNHKVPQGVIDRAALRGIEALCRRALSRPTDEGVPFAQPSGIGKQSQWQQLDLFTQAQTYALIARRVKNLTEDHEAVRRLWTWCLERFGSAPDIPELVIPVTT